MKIETLNVGELNPAPYNPRTISKEALEGLKASIGRFGYCEPIIINDDNTVIGGHQRLKALQELGINQAQVVRLNLNKTEEKALNVVLNSKHTSGEFDLKELEPLLAELKIDFDGFEELNLDVLIDEYKEDSHDGAGKVKGDSEIDFDDDEEIPLFLNISNRDYEKWKSLKKQFDRKDDSELLSDLIEECYAEQD